MAKKNNKILEVIKLLFISDRNLNKINHILKIY